MRVSDGTRAARFDRWGLEGETIELAVLRGTVAGRERYMSLATLDFVATHLEADDSSGATLDGGRVRRFATRLIQEGMIGTLAVSFSPSGVFVPAGDDAPIGTLLVPRATRFTIVDGRHRHAAIRRALSDDPRLALETVALELYADDRAVVRRPRALAPPGDHAMDAARLTALNMALNGRSRGEVDDYLTENFGFGDNDELLDEVFTTQTGGPQVS